MSSLSHSVSLHFVQQASPRHAQIAPAHFVPTNHRSQTHFSYKYHPAPATHTSPGLISSRHTTSTSWVAHFPTNFSTMEHHSSIRSMPPMHDLLTIAEPYPARTPMQLQCQGRSRSPISLLTHKQNCDQTPPATPTMTSIASTSPSSATPPSSSSSPSPTHRPSFWQTVLSSPLKPAAYLTNSTTPIVSSPKSTLNQPDMNIPCVICGVRFRKPGHLDMHWRSVHARHHPSSVYEEQRCMSTAPHTLARSPTYTKKHIIPEYAQHDHDDGDTHTPHKLSSRCAPSTSIRVAAEISKGSRAYACPQCDASFRRGSDRNRHMRMVHAKIRPFECLLCGNHFGRKSFLEAHVLTVHHKLRPFRCQCGAAFGQRSSLTRHARKIHGREPVWSSSSSCWAIT